MRDIRQQQIPEPAQLHQSFKDIGQRNFFIKSKIKVVLKSAASHACLTLTARPSQQYLVSWPHLNDTSVIIRVKPHQNSLEAAFSARQCDHCVEIHVSYFCHISRKSGFQRIHGEVITSHWGKNPAWRLLDRKKEGWHEPQGWYHNSRGGQVKNWNVWDKIALKINKS